MPNRAVAASARAIALAATVTCGCSASGHLEGVARLDPAGGGVSVTLTGPMVARTTSDASGSYTFAGLPDGTYTLTASAPSTEESEVQTSATVTHGSGKAPDLVLTPAGTITGSVTLGGAATGNAGIVVFVGGGKTTAVTDDAGHYVLSGVRAGAQRVGAAKAGYTTATSDPVTVVWGRSAMAADFSLLPGSTGVAGVDGVVTLLGLTDFSGTTVDVAGTTFTTTSDASGSFDLSAVPTGVYPLSFVNGSYQDTIPAVQVIAGAGAFVADDADGKIYALQPIELPQASRIVGGATNPVVSSDGTLVLTTGRQHEVQIVPVAGGTVTTLSSSVAFAPTLRAAPEYRFLPGSAVLVLTADRVLKTVPAGGGGATQLGSAVDDFVLSPDQKSIVSFTQTNTRVGDVSFVSVAGGTPMLLSHDVNWDPANELPTFSADGNGIVFRDTSNRLMYWPINSGVGGALVEIAANTLAWRVLDTNKLIVEHSVSSTTNIGVCDLATPSTLADLVTDANYLSTNWTFAVGPNRHDLLYYAALPNGGVHNIIGFDGASPTVAQVSAKSDSPTAAYFSPDQSLVVWESGFTIFVAPAAGSAAPAPKVLSPSTNTPTGLSVSPDGAFALWIDDVGNGDAALTAAPLGGTIAQVTPAHVADHVGAYLAPGTNAAVFSPDGKRLLAVANTVHLGGLGHGDDVAAGDLELVALDGSGNLTVGTPALTDQQFGFSPDGAHVYYFQPAPGDVVSPDDNSHSINPTLYVVSIAGGALGAVTPVLGRSLAPVVWADAATVLGARLGSTAPYSFQDGVYAAAVK